MTAAFIVSTLLLGGLFCIGLGFLLSRIKPDESSKSLIQERTENTFLKKENKELLRKIQEREEKLQTLREEHLRETVLKEAAQKELESQAQLLSQMKEKLTLEFKNLAQNIFEKKTEQSEKSLSAILNPLKEKITDFKNQVSDFYDKEGKQRHSLEMELKNLVEAHQKTTSETARLSRALKGSAKIQGDWGEMVLERILQASGLREGSEFTLQGKGLGMKTEEGESLKPDVVVHLPDKRDIVIDSKVSLIDYYNYLKAETEEEKETCARHTSESLLKHVKNLSEKDYSASDKVNAPRFTFMFIPLEGVFSLALSRDQSLFEKAWQQSIVIVTPTNLLATLKTVSSIWKMEKQNKNVRKIALESGKMYDKFVGFLEDMKNLEKGLDTAQKNYHSAFNKLKGGTGNLIARAEKIKHLGAGSKKDLPAVFLPDSPEETD